MKAVFSPASSFSDPQARKYAGWLKIPDLFLEGLKELGFDVFIPPVPREMLDRSTTVSHITSYDLMAADVLPDDVDLFLGPPGYSLAQMMKLRASGHASKILTYVFNNADWYRDQMLADEYKSFFTPYDLSPTWRWINRRALEISDHVIACSPFVKATHANVVSANKISIAFWGVDSQRFKPAEEEPEGFRVLWVGSDPIRKGLRYLWQALEHISLPMELWVAGSKVDWPMPPNIRIRQLGLIPYDDMPEVIRQCHVLCLPSLEDGIALSIQEAMASRVVPITTQDPAEVFRGGISGKRIPYRNSQEIARALTFLYEHSDIRRDMALAARALAETQTWDKTKEDFKTIITRVMKGGSLPFESPMHWLKG